MKNLTKKVGHFNLKEAPHGKGADKLLQDIRALIESARRHVARVADSSLVMLHWHVGKRIREDILKEKRAEYGKGIIATLSQRLGWSHFVELLPIEDSLKRDFYAEMSTYFFIIGSSDVWLPSNSNWTNSKPSSKAKWNCICVG